MSIKRCKCFELRSQLFRYHNIVSCPNPSLAKRKELEAPQTLIYSLIITRTGITELSRQQTNKNSRDTFPPLTDIILETVEVLIEFNCFWDISANLLLQDTIERIHVGDKYGDIPRGIFLIRGENMVLVGEIVSSF